MRKIIHIFLIFSLLISTAGYAVTKHFCGEILAHVSFGHDEKFCCEGMEMPSGCECANEIGHVVIDDDYQLDQQKIKLDPALQLTLVSIIKYLAFAPLLEGPENKLHDTLDYPLFTDPDIHISFQSFLL